MSRGRDHPGEHAGLRAHPRDPLAKSGRRGDRPAQHAAPARGRAHTRCTRASGGRGRTFFSGAAAAGDSGDALHPQRAPIPLFAQHPGRALRRAGHISGRAGGRRQVARTKKAAIAAFFEHISICPRRVDVGATSGCPPVTQRLLRSIMF